MDNNNPAPQPIQPTMQPAQAPQPSEGGNKMVLWLVTGLIITILIVGGVYWYLNSQKAEPKENSAKSKSSQTEANLEKDLNLINVPEVDAQFLEVDKDLESL